jgi:4-amino-4-deoxy-L-arabinose transferase-like glycosyltransferase
MKALQTSLLLGYFTILLLLAPINLLSFDTFYYWEWSRHLDFGYYDGSPMIAYLIKAATLLFGDTLFALSFIGIASAAVTSWIIYKTARLFLSKEASGISMLLWLFSPWVTLDIIKQTTYDTPLTIFWALALYFAAQLITTHKIRYLYFLGATLGFLLLSKYSGAVLILALFLFLITTQYRYLLKSVHFYLSILLTAIIFSPVILWNQQHQWQSFLYQLTTHQLKTTLNPIFSVIKSFFYAFLPTLNFMLIPPTLCWLKGDGQDANRKASIVGLCQLIGTTMICFYLVAATLATIKNAWLTTYLISSALLGGYCFQILNYRKSTHLLIGVYLIASLGIIINNTYHLFTTPSKLIHYRLLQTFNDNHPQLPKIVLAPGWLEARMLFFLKDKPPVYTIDCGSPQNQYALWSKDIIQKIADRTIQEVVFISPIDQGYCVKKYFDNCIQLTPEIYFSGTIKHGIYAYICKNSQ